MVESDLTNMFCGINPSFFHGICQHCGREFQKWERNTPSIVALSLSLTSTICFLAILAFRSQSLNFWRYVPFMLQLAILTMFASIVALWTSLMLQGKSLTTYAILSTPIAILTIVSLPIFIGPALMSMFTKVPPRNRYITRAIRYQKPLEDNNNALDFGRNQVPSSNLRRMNSMWHALLARQYSGLNTLV